MIGLNEANLDVTLRDARPDDARLDFVRKLTDSVRLTRRVDLRRKWGFVSDVRLRKDTLVWRVAEPERLREDCWIFDGAVERQAILKRRQAEHDGHGVFDDFLVLYRSKDTAILKFAETWGVLELCCHNLPACHEFRVGVPLRLPGALPAKAVRRVVRTFDPDPRQCSPLGREPLATWRFFSKQASAILSIAGDLQRGRLGEDDDWTILLKDGVRPKPSKQAQRNCVRDMVEGWLKLGRIKPAIDDLSGALRWTGADLFGELAVQLALTVAQIDGCVFCIACGKPYSPKRRVIKHGFNLLPRARVPERSCRLPLKEIP
jgi:hypothetical protein